MSEMVNKVARALRADEWGSDDWDSATAEDQEYWRKGARVAIGAMKEPTKEMAVRPGFFAEAWRGAIDEALK